jgi:hypothetical protein
MKQFEIKHLFILLIAASVAIHPILSLASTADDSGESDSDIEAHRYEKNCHRSELDAKTRHYNRGELTYLFCEICAQISKESLTSKLINSDRKLCDDCFKIKLAEFLRARMASPQTRSTNFFTHKDSRFEHSELYKARELCPEGLRNELQAYLDQIAPPDSRNLADDAAANEENLHMAQAACCVFSSIFLGMVFYSFVVD